MYRCSISRFILIAAAILSNAAGCKKDEPPPVQAVPEPILSEGDLSAARKALHQDLEVTSRALCRRKPALGKTLPGDSSRMLTDLVTDLQTIEACASNGAVAQQTGSSQGRDRDGNGPPGKKRDRTKTGSTTSPPVKAPCSRLWNRLSNVLAHEIVCSPFAMTSRSGDRPPQIRRAVRFVDVLLADTSRIVEKSPKRALSRLLLLAMLLEDFERGPVPWSVAVTLTNIWPKLAESFARVLSRLRQPSRTLPRQVSSLRRALPTIRSVLLGEHLHRLAAAGLLPGRVDLSGSKFPALDTKGGSPQELRALADHQSLALLLARHFYRRALAGCRGRSLSVCQAALRQVDKEGAQDHRLEKLHQTFLVRFQSFPQFRALVLSAVAQQGEKKLSEDKAASRYWNKLIAWAHAWDLDNLPLLARPGFFLAAVGYHVKVGLFLARHPTRAIYSQVAPFVFSFSEPFSGKPIVAKPSGHDVEVTPPAQASALKVSAYVIRLKH